ncbi:hypothetical protein HDU97_006720 [Phlyctochytrium planicorne]|nr:hypothetical protein HDU97_006720 [Phlyctochytrium planicorne]
MIEYRNSDGEVELAQCPLKMDALCLNGRYGEDLEESIQSGTWVCPKCRGKKPTGQLKNFAVQKGFKGVSEYLEAIGQVLPKGKKRKTE